jgi:thiol-disulfide isomerase/thioredoxin
MATTFLVLAGFLSTASARQDLGIKGHPAPPWEVTQWHQLPEGKTELGLNDFKGKVIYLYGFQSWCPGCHSSGFPTLKKVSDHYVGDDAVAFVAVQTVFEGFSSNTFENVKAIAKKYDLKMPMGHSGSEEKRSAIMGGYRTGGTPWTIIIGKDGKVAYNDFHIKPSDAIELIDGLKK